MVIPPMSHLMKTWKTAAVIKLYSNPIVALFTSQKLLTRICTIKNTAMGTSAPSKAAAQMGTISLRSG